jgi:hypothetical protein
VLGLGSPLRRLRLSWRPTGLLYQTPPPDPTIFVILLQDNIGRLSPQDVKIASHSI